jgi:predicted nucleic acid-binding protein
MDKIFLDTNVILDYLLARSPYDADAKRFFVDAELGKIELFASALTFCNMSYIVRKLKTPAEFQALLSDLLQLIAVTSIDGLVLHQAIAANYKDFEDAVQYQSALNTYGLTHLVTRNKADFTETTLPIFSPSEYWQSKI